MVARRVNGGISGGGKAGQETLHEASHEASCCPEEICETQRRQIPNSREKAQKTQKKKREKISRKEDREFTRKRKISRKGAKPQSGEEGDRRKIRYDFCVKQSFTKSA
jgi:hypothetical protein